MAESRQKLLHVRYYNRIAHLYNKLYWEEQNRKFEVALGKLNHRHRVSVLDLGCGTGLLFQKMQTQAALLVGLDLSRNMLKEIEKPKRGSNMTHLVVADADHSPLRSKLFDLIFAITLLQNMPNPTQTLREMKRVAKSNALLVVSGLRKIFDEELFLELLGNAELEVVALRSSPNLKCHLAICRNR